MFDANNIPARSYVSYQAWMSAAGSKIIAI